MVKTVSALNSSARGGNGSIGLSGFALVAGGAASSELVQTIGVDNLGANGNEMDILVTGDFNRFGVFQGGRLNSVGQITIQGNLNQIGIRQEGLENDLTSSLINGDGNNIGVDQWGHQHCLSRYARTR